MRFCVFVRCAVLFMHLYCTCFFFAFCAFKHKVKIHHKHCFPKCQCTRSCPTFVFTFFSSPLHQPSTFFPSQPFYFRLPLVFPPYTNLIFYHFPSDYCSYYLCLFCYCSYSCFHLHWREQN
jgi:hypothetical protein